MSPAAQAAVKPMPRGWLSLALLGWGFFADALPSAVVMLLMLEGVGLSPVKWNLGVREFHRAADLTSVVFAIVTIAQFSRYSVHGIYQILAAAPYCFFPLLLAQRASVARTIPMSALFYSLRRYPEHDRALDIAPHYLVVCMLAASTSASGGYGFIAFSAVLLIGLLLRMRPRRYRLWQCLASIVLALSLAALTQLGMLRTQQLLEQSFMYWLNQFPWSSSDPNRAMTAIGAIGRLKLSDQIRVRVTPADGLQLPLMLQEASYDTFKFGSWSAPAADFEALDKISNRDAWNSSIVPSTSNESFEITIQHRRELTVLPVPRGTRQVVADEIAELQQNRFGTLLAESPPGALRFRAIAGPPYAVEPPPTERDSKVPDAYAGVLAEINAEIGIDRSNAAATATRVRDFFLNNFSYSLIQRGSFGRRTPLAHFLTRTRRGHCEYFASAAVLLLRQAGIPARYAVGYMVEDYSELEGAYIARARHAHAWALAFVDGQWITLDATPSVWFGLENEFASRWQSLQDLGAWLWYRYQRLSQADFSELSDWLIWLVPPLALVLYLRLKKSPLAVSRRQPQASNNEGPDYLAFGELMAQLKQRGLVPADGETMAAFLSRATPATADRPELHSIVTSYYRQRFAASPATEDERVELSARVRRFTQKLFA